MKAILANNKSELSVTKSLVVIITFFILMFLLNTNVMAQDKHQMVRIAKITVDPSQLEQYTAALKEQMTTAIRIEPGVLTYYAVADKKNPSNITILEMYADTAAYIFAYNNSSFQEIQRDSKKYGEVVRAY